MIKKILGAVKKVVFAFLVLYSFNLLLNSVNIFIPINLFTLGTITFLGLPGYLSLLGMFFITK